MSLPLRDSPLRRKTATIIVLASALALVISLITVLVYESTTYRPRVLEEIEAESGLLVPIVVAAIRFDDERAAEDDLGWLEASADIRFGALFTADGALFASYLREGVDAAEIEPPADSTTGAVFTRNRLRWTEEIRDEGELIGRLVLVRDLPPLWARLPQYGLMLGSVLLSLAAAAIVILAAIGGLVSRPIQDLARAAQTVRDRGDFGVRVEKAGDDEVGRLTEAFNEMLHTIQERDSELRAANAEQKLLHEQLIQAQKLESIGRLAGGVAHDFNNLLTVIIGSTELVRRQLSSDSAARAYLEQVQRATEQATHLTRQLLTFARKQVVEPKVLDPGQLVLEVEKMLRRLIGTDIELVVVPRRGVWPILADPSQMTQVLVNLAVNARDAMPSGGRLTVEVANTELTAEGVRDEPELGPGEWVVISAADTGIGMSDEVRRHIFEPFFTTKEWGKGTGLGLATCFGIVKQCGGHIRVRSQIGKGSVFEIYLPRSRSEPGADDPGGRGDSLPRGHETVLVVEDNPLVRSTAVELLRAQGYRVLEAANGPDAIALADDGTPEIDLLVTDVVMPQMSGQSVVENLRQRIADLKVLYVSGYTADAITNDGGLGAEVAFLQKPFTSAALIRKVRELLDAPPLTGAAAVS